VLWLAGGALEGRLSKGNRRGTADKKKFRTKKKNVCPKKGSGPDRHRWVLGSRAGRGVFDTKGGLFSF